MVFVYSDETAQSIIKEIRAQLEWNLDPDIDHELTNTRTHTVLASSNFMTADLIEPGDILDLGSILSC